MKKTMGAQTASEGRTESRFATLTAGLLARKGQAAPSNSPVADPAEETEAYSLGEDLIQRAVKAIRPSPDPKPPDAKVQTAKAPEKAAPPVAASADEERAAPAYKRNEETLDLAQIKVINERSAEAGYPENPTPEEIAAMEAEAESDAASSYLSKVAAQFDDEENLDFEEEFEPAENSFQDNRVVDMHKSAGRAASLGAGPWTKPSVPEVFADDKPLRRAAVTFRMTARDFLRLKLGSAELDMTAQDIILEAVEEFLDARGVESLAGCQCLKSAIMACEKSCGDAVFEDD
jgi:hypothetical protein